MAAVAPDLRPRGAVELYDAALHLCARGGTALPALSVLGAALPAVAGLALGYRAVHGQPFLAAAAVFALSLMVRGIFAGAASLAAEAALEGRGAGPGQALRRAGARAASLMSAAGLLPVIQWILTPATLGIGVVLWAPLAAAIPLVARGDAGPWSMGVVCRARLGRAPAMTVRSLHGVASLIVLVNLHTGIAVALHFGRVLLGFDVTFLARFASLTNPIYDLFLLGLAGVLLEPVKNALGVLLLADARVRSEGLDLEAAADRLLLRRGKGVAIGLALLIGLGALAPVPARAAAPTTVERLDRLIEELSLRDDPEDALLAADAIDAVAAREAEGAEDVEDEWLRRFVGDVERVFEEEEERSLVAAMLREGLARVVARGGQASTGAAVVNAAAIDRLEEVFDALALWDDADLVRDAQAALRLEGADAVSLRRFVDGVARDLDAEVEEDARLVARLREGLAEARAVVLVQEEQVDPQALARAILAGEEFQSSRGRPEGEEDAGDERESWLMGALQRFFDWLSKLMPEPSEPKTRSGRNGFAGLGGGVFEIVSFVLAGIALAALVWLVVVLLRRGRRGRSAPDGVAASGAATSEAEGESALARAPEGWWSEADRLAARGELRAAVRALYLAALAALHRRGAIEYDPALSNWDYVRAFRGGAGELPRFRDLTRRFDFVWYGRVGADAEGYARVRELARPILEREAPDA